MKNYFLLILGFMQLSFSVAQTQNNSIFKQEWAWLGLDFSQVKLVGAEGFSDLPQIKDYYFDQWNLLMYTENSKYNIPNNMGLRSINHYPNFFEQINSTTPLEGLVVNNEVYLSLSEIEEIVANYSFDEVSEEVALVLIVESLNKRDLYGAFWTTVINTKTNELIFAERMLGKPKGFGFRNYWAGSIYNVIKQYRKKKWYRYY
jgi:hypothetical protein